MSRIIYTYTDESPMLASASLFPILHRFLTRAGIDIETRDISLAARILAAFADLLPDDQREPDTLSELGDLAQQPDANIIKLPNISASVPQLLAAIKELQNLGYDLPDYPKEPVTDEEKDIRARYDGVKGSAVNPVLREGNSDRRAPRVVKNYAKSHPHQMGTWHPDSKTRVATMTHGDFRSNEQSAIVPSDETMSIVHVAQDGTETILHAGIPILEGEIVDVTKLEATKLDAFLAEQVEAAKNEGVLFSLHLKATMMKVSDPIIFGHAVTAYFPQTFKQYGHIFASAGLNPNNGLGALLEGIRSLPMAEDIRRSFESEALRQPGIAMVNSDKGITNLHVPSDVIVDASMPAMIRNGGKMYDKDGNLADALAVIPDSSYAGVYEEVINDCKANGAFNPQTMGTVPNVGLMAQKAEEYGSHDKTFEISADGVVEIRLSDSSVLLSISVSSGDIFRGTQTKDGPVKDWVGLAVRRARLSGMPAVFWLDDERSHDQALKAKVTHYLATEDTDGLDIRIMTPQEATRFTLDRVRAGKDTISVTGNVLRDYLTDLFPIMELGTSAKMLSIVPLMAGGGLFETGAGGSAPKLAQQLITDNHLRWDSLGEFLALAESLRHLAIVDSNSRAQVMADALDAATERLLNENKSPQKLVGTIDNRGSHVWLATWWAQALSQQTQDLDIAQAFHSVAQSLEENAERIEHELLEIQGKPVDLGGYYRPDSKAVDRIMRPSASFNAILESLG